MAQSELTLDELEALADAATPGPWEELGGYIVPTTGGELWYGDEIASVRKPENLTYIAAICNAIPALIARVRKLDATITAKEKAQRGTENELAAAQIRIRDLEAALRKEKALLENAIREVTRELVSVERERDGLQERLLRSWR